MKPLASERARDCSSLEVLVDFLVFLRFLRLEKEWRWWEKREYMPVQSEASSLEMREVSMAGEREGKSV